MEKIKCELSIILIPSVCIIKVSYTGNLSVIESVPLGGSRGLAVMRGDSCSEGCRFKSQHQILDGHFSHIFVVKMLMFVWKEENKWNEVGDGPFFQ